MFKIKNNAIEITRGDTVTMNLKINNYSFKPDDKIEFRVYPKKNMGSKPLIDKIININEESEEAVINLTSEETKIGDIISKPVVYWYEVELNDGITVIGYDENGAKTFTVYPEGFEEKLEDEVIQDVY